VKRYQPPTGDEPLDPIEESWIEIVVARVVREIRDEEAARAARTPPSRVTHDKRSA
jgi:hypothetical protein